MTAKTVNVSEVVESADFIGLPLRIAALMFFIMLVDGFDLSAMGNVASELGRPISEGGWEKTRADLGGVLSASMWGMMVGSIALGWVADRIGRKNAYVVCIAFLFLGSTLCALSTGPADLFWYRFLTGIGLGGVTPIAATLISEWTARKPRSLAVVCVIVAVPFGGLVGAEAIKYVLDHYNWRTVFWIGAAFPLIFLVLAQFLLVESPKYMVRHPKHHKALAKALNTLVKENRYTGDENFIIGEEVKSAGAAVETTSPWYVAIFSKPFLVTTLLLWVAISANTIALYSFVNLLPTMFTEGAGLDRDVGLTSMTWFNFGGVGGSVAGAFLIRYYGSRLVGTTASTVGAIACVVLGLIVLNQGLSAGLQIYLPIAIAGLALNGMQAFVYTVGANSYPVSIRAAGVGMAQTMSRFGAALITFEGATIFPNIQSYFFIIAGVMVFVILSYASLRTHLNSNKRNTELEAEALRDGAQI